MNSIGLEAKEETAHTHHSEGAKGVHEVDNFRLVQVRVNYTYILVFFHMYVSP